MKCDNALLLTQEIQKKKKNCRENVVNFIFISKICDLEWDIKFIF
jgi:hypothetical protein